METLRAINSLSDADNGLNSVHFWAEHMNGKSKLKHFKQKRGKDEIFLQIVLGKQTQIETGLTRITRNTIPSEVWKNFSRNILTFMSQ